MDKKKAALVSALVVVAVGCRPGASPSAGSDAGSDARGAGGGGGVCAAVTAGEQTSSLAGTWTFTPSGAAATTIQVPGGGWLAQGFHLNARGNQFDAARYARTITVPSLGVPQATLIEFGAVNHQAALFIDGTAIGTNLTSFTPSIFDVTSAVTPEGQHELAVDVKGRFALFSTNGRKLVPDAAGWSPNVPEGIFRSAVLRVLPVLHVSDVFVRTSVGADMLGIEVSLTNSGAAAATGTVSAALSSWNCDALSYPALPSVTVTVPAGQTVTIILGPVRWGLGAGSYWWPNVPYTPGYRARLHYASVSVAGTGGAQHTVPVRFGFREIRQVGAHYELNGVRVNFRGDNLQGVDYDSIRAAAGVSDAYDLLPGFLPPSATSAGWPLAADNWQRLNYNVARIHQEPASPYMLDLLDEVGFMVIDETAIRGTNGDQDFSPAPDGGEPNMLAHAQALVRRDRNHPSVIRWSQCNEAENNEFPSFATAQTFQLHLYQAITAVDDTRPVSAESTQRGAGADALYTLIPEGNFVALEHYPGGLGMFSQTVTPSTTRPFGVGEFIWPRDNSLQGFLWFGTNTMHLRSQDASDLRPYTLLSGWASFVPGVTTDSMTLEPYYPPDGLVHHPLFGSDNLPDPWANPIIQRIQRGMSPVLVADVAFWNANQLSNADGDWPVVVETVEHGASLLRMLIVFNDTFAGTAVEVTWEMHTDSPTGAIADQGAMQLTIPLGQRVTIPIVVRAPATGTRGYLVLQSNKGGPALFREDAEYFILQ